MVAYNNSVLVEQINRFSSSIDEDGSGGSLDEIIHLHLYKAVPANLNKDPFIKPYESINK